DATVKSTSPECVPGAGPNASGGNVCSKCSCGVRILLKSSRMEPLSITIVVGTAYVAQAFRPVGSRQTSRSALHSERQLSAKTANRRLGQRNRAVVRVGEIADDGQAEPRSRRRLIRAHTAAQDPFVQRRIQPRTIVVDVDDETMGVRRLGGNPHPRPCPL